MPILVDDLSIIELYGRSEVISCSNLPTSGLDELLIPERESVQGAVEKRQREYATGRVLARELLARLGIEDFPLVNDADRVPIWPTGIIGSISHCPQACVVVIAPASDALRSLSVDVEVDEPLEAELWSTIATDQETRWIEAQSRSEWGRLMKLLFSAKEAIYKCQFPITRRPLEFRDVSLQLDPKAGTYRADIRPESGNMHTTATTITGRLRRSEGLILTAASLTQDDVNRIDGR